MVYTVLNPNQDTYDNWHPAGAGYRDSTDNPYRSAINDILCMHGVSGAYGAAWGTVSLPSSPSDFRTVVRHNTDTSETRIYTYDGSSWQTIGYGTASSTLDGLSDVVITSVVWNGSQWVNNTLAEAGVSAVGHTHAHSDLTGIVANEHLDWTLTGAGIIHVNNYVDNDTTYINTDWNHDALTNFDSGKHFLQSDITTVGTVTVGNIDAIANYIAQRGIDDTPVDGVVDESITSNWAYDHQNNPTNINHLTDSQVSALHSIFVPAAVTAHTDITSAGSGIIISDIERTNFGTAYTYSQVGHLPLAGGTLTGNLTFATGANIQSADDDLSFIFGRASVGGWGSYVDFAAFGHRDVNSFDTTYALLQNNNGVTYLNTASGQTGHIRVADSDILTWDANSVNIAAGKALNVGGTIGITNNPTNAYFRTIDSTTDYLHIYMGSSSTGVRLNSGTYAWISHSDINYKTNVSYPTILDKILAVDLIEYDHYENTEFKGDYQHEIGVDAKQLRLQFPMLVFGDDSIGDRLSVDYTHMSAILFGGFKELKIEKDEEIKNLNNVIDTLITENKDILSRIKKLEELI